MTTPLITAQVQSINFNTISGKIDVNFGVLIESQPTQALTFSTNLTDLASFNPQFATDFTAIHNDGMALVNYLQSNGIAVN